ncbi:MAG: hypothetical protein CFE40_02365 [Burkholderiales bacterium PBB1]|nr:MAG: hypothetical protein CFE40_02365 [Burkholderiales bacterium PBB1]
MSRWFPEQLAKRIPAPLRALWPGARATAVELRLTDTRPEALEQQLDALALAPNTRLTCIVAGEGVRYRIVPWRDELSQPAQRQLLAEQCFSDGGTDIDTGAHAPRHWTVRQHTARHGAATLAAAIDTSVLDHLTAQARARHCTLSSVQPALMHAYNLARHHIAPGLHGVVVIDAASTTLLLQSPHEPLLVKRTPAPPGDLAAMLEREWFALGLEVERCPVYVVRSDVALTPSLQGSASGWSIVDLTPSVPGESISAATGSAMAVAA